MVALAAMMGGQGVVVSYLMDDADIFGTVAMSYGGCG